MAKLTNKVAIITGGTSGMGRGIAELFASEGAKIVISGRDAKRGDEVVRGIQAKNGTAVFVRSDVTKPEANNELVEKAVVLYGGVDILVMSAGILGIGSITNVPLEVWHETIAANLHAVFYLCRAGIPQLQRRGGGTIVVIGSIAAYKGFPNHPAYCASKGALVPFVKQAAMDYAPQVRINLLCPGPVDTPLIWDSAKAFPNPERAVADVAEKTLMKRLGTPQDVASAALFLASDDSKWITGAALTIDGGIMCGG